MPSFTASFLVDLADTGGFATDITSYVYRDGGLDIPAIGRNQELGLAESGSINFVLDNRDGRFSPSNPGSAYYPNWHPYHLVKVTDSFNSVTYNLFYGLITDLKVAGDQKNICYLTAKDLMYVLARTDIRCPLMQGYTGPIINRLLDRAEVGEAVSNPTSEQGTSNWTVGVSTITQMTTGNLEGPYSVQLIAGAANDGVQHTVDSGQNGVAVTGVAYVRPETTADVGLRVRLRLHDNIGIVTTGSYTALDQTDRWQRLTIAGTYNGGSSSQYLTLQCETSGTTVRIGALHMTPTAGAIARLVDKGQSYLDAFTYHRGKALPAIQKVAENELGGLFYMDGAGNAVFEDRHHRWMSDHLTSQGTFDERGTVNQSETAEDRIKEVVIDYPRWYQGTAGTVLWTSDRVPIRIAAGGMATFEIDFNSAAMTLVSPLHVADYTTSYNPEVTSSDASITLMTVSEFTDEGGGCHFAITNGNSADVWITFLQIRGKPIRAANDRTPARYTDNSGPKLSSVLSHNYDLLGREPDVQGFANYLGSRYSTQKDRIILELSAPFPVADVTTTDMVQILARAPSDRITITNDTLASSTKVNGDYYIDHVTRRIVGGDQSHIEATWNLIPVDDSYAVTNVAVTNIAVTAPY